MHNQTARAFVFTILGIVHTKSIVIVSRRLWVWSLSPSVWTWAKSAVRVQIARDPGHLEVDMVVQSLVPILLIFELLLRIVECRLVKSRPMYGDPNSFAHWYLLSWIRRRPSNRLMDVTHLQCTLSLHFIYEYMPMYMCHRFSYTHYNYVCRLGVIT